MFALDGVKLPSKEWSGSQADYSKKIEKMERAVRHLTERHQAADTAGEDEGQAAARAKQQATLEKALAEVRGYLQGHQDKVGSNGRIKQSNITDNESAKMTSSKGVIQGYTAVAMVDGKHQIVVHAEAHGEGQEHGLLSEEHIDGYPGRPDAICPAGKRLYRNGRHKDLNGYEAIRFRGNKGDCRDCALRARYLRHPDKTVERQVALFIGRAKGKPETYSAKMKRKLDSELGRHRYSRRLGIVEPVFANIRSSRRLGRFSHRGRRKVTTQWQLFCLVHNIGKVQRYAEF
jgi:hypothetical protein